MNFGHLGCSALSKFSSSTPPLARWVAWVMDQLIPSLSGLVEGFRGCFRQEVFVTFHQLLVGRLLPLDHDPSVKSGRSLGGLANSAGIGLTDHYGPCRSG
jgi:hypothetical protein